jgi:hypothetical protein
MELEVQPASEVERFVRITHAQMCASPDTTDPSRRAAGGVISR